MEVLKSNDSILVYKRIGKEYDILCINNFSKQSTEYKINGIDLITGKEFINEVEGLGFTWIKLEK